MGASCCTGAKDKDLPNRIGSESFHRNSRCSPTWSLRWENRRRVAGEVDDSSYQMSLGHSRDITLEMKGALGSDRGDISEGLSLRDSFGTPISVKSPVHEGINLMRQPLDMSTESSYCTEGKNIPEFPDTADLFAARLSYSTCSSLSTPVAYPSRICGFPLPPSSTPSRRARYSPGHQLSRQISDSRIVGLKSPNSYSLSEGRPSFVLSTSRHDLVMGSHGRSSDGWSVQTFTELVASSQKGRWSFDSEHLDTGFGKTSGCSGRFPYAPFSDPQTCGACSKLLTERSFVANNELPVVAVLVCGHAYHAQCLEAMTMEADKYDPACPICMGGEKQLSKMFSKVLRAEAELRSKSHKISRNRVIDSYLDSDSDEFYHQKEAIQDRGSPKLELIFNATSSSRKSFLKPHFPFGSNWSRSLSENSSARRKGFWVRHPKQ